MEHVKDTSKSIYLVMILFGGRENEVAEQFYNSGVPCTSEKIARDMCERLCKKHHRFEHDVRFGYLRCQPNRILPIEYKGPGSIVYNDFVLVCTKKGYEY